MDRPAINVVNLSKTFGKIRALSQIDLQVDEGEFLAIFGPNGAGKTTLVNLISASTRPTEGNIYINGIDLGRDHAKIRAQIGVISHNTFLYKELTAEENLRFYGEMYDVSDLGERISLSLEQIGMSHRKDDRVSTFSRGQKQRLSITRALLHSPPILLLDEPYTGLDQNASEAFTDILEELKEGKRTIIMATHNMEKGLQLSDAAAILARGKLVYHKRAMEADGDRKGPPKSIEELFGEKLEHFKEIYRQHVKEQ